MALLGKARNADLELVIRDLGEEVPPSAFKMQLVKTITSSVNYDEEYVKSILEGVTQERLEKERSENEEREREKDREKEERARQEREKDKLRAHELEMLRLGAGTRASSETSEISQVGPRKFHPDLQKLVPKFDPEKSDISLYLVIFERQASRANLEKSEWVSHLLGLLPLEIVQLIAREPDQEAEDYDHVKQILLKKFKLSPEAIRLKFVQNHRRPESTWKDFVFELRSYLEEWLEGLEINDYEKLKDLMVSDQLKKRVSPEVRDHFIDDWATISSSSKLADMLDNYECVRKGPKKSPSTCGSDRLKIKSSSTFPTNDKPNFRGAMRGRDDWKGDRKSDAHFEKRKRAQCYECGSYTHLRPQCWKLKSSKEEVNRLGKSSDDRLLAPYTFKGKINGLEMPILRDTGATVDVVCQKYVAPERFTGDHVWVQHLLDEQMTCLPIAEVDIECDLGCISTKAAVIRDSLDQGRYLLGNQTAALFDEVNENAQMKSKIVNAVVTRARARLQEAKSDGNILASDDPTKEQSRIQEEEEIIYERGILPSVTIEDPVLTLSQIDSEKFIQEQKNCEELAPLILAGERGSKDSKGYTLRKGILVMKKISKLGQEKILLVVPKKLREQVKTMCHEGTSGHLGVLKTKDRLVRHFFWPNCYKEIEEFVRTCDACQRVGQGNDQKKAPLQLVPVISEVFSKINVDACGPLPTSSDGNRYLITAMCLASKYPDAVPVTDISSKSVVDALLQIFSRIGFPKEIQTDQGSSFMSSLTVEFLEKSGIKVIRSSVYHPQTNPVERLHRTLKRILRVLCIEAAPDWERQIPAALFALRTVTHESTGFSPAELVYGNNLRTPMTLLYEKWLEPPEAENTVVEYVFEIMNRLKKCRELASEKMEEMRDRRKKWYDKNAVKREFHEGDLVLVLTTSRPHKLAVKWKGPGKIEKKISETNYVVSFEGKREINQVFHINMLKPYYKRPELVNMCLDQTESSEVEEDFPCIEKDPNIFDFNEIIENSSLRERLEDKQIQELHDLLIKYATLFSNIPGKTNLVEHDIELLSEKPVRTKPYRMTHHQNEILKSEIDKMLRYNIIEPGESEYTSPMILVESPGRDPRPCIDYRKLNEITRTQVYPIPNIEQRVETVAKATYITLIDLTKGYWQIKLSQKAQKIAAFTTNFGVYRPLRMPFGLKNAPFDFSKMMSEFLKGCEEYAVPYLDDIAIFSQSWEDHIIHVKEILERLKRAQLTIKPSKCKFAQNEVQYLGHIVGRGKRSPAELKVKAIHEFPNPTTKTEIRA